VSALRWSALVVVIVAATAPTGFFKGAPEGFRDIFVVPTHLRLLVVWALFFGSFRS
jgi:hypothetical protein